MRARLVLASILEGNAKRATWELTRFKSLHAGEQGKLAGKTGPLSDTLEQLFEQSRTWSSTAPFTDWPTFAGRARSRWTGRQRR